MFRTGESPLPESEYRKQDPSDICKDYMNGDVIKMNNAIDARENNIEKGKNIKFNGQSTPWKERNGIDESIALTELQLNGLDKIPDEEINPQGDANNTRNEENCNGYNVSFDRERDSTPTTVGPLSGRSPCSGQELKYLMEKKVVIRDTLHHKAVQVNNISSSV